MTAVERRIKRAERRRLCEEREGRGCVVKGRSNVWKGRGCVGKGRANVPEWIGNAWKARGNVTKGRSNVWQGRGCVGRGRAKVLKWVGNVRKGEGNERKGWCCVVKGGVTRGKVVKTFLRVVVRGCLVGRRLRLLDGCCSGLCIRECGRTVSEWRGFVVGIWKRVFEDWIGTTGIEAWLDGCVERLLGIPILKWPLFLCDGS